MILGVWNIIFLFISLPAWLDKTSALVVGLLLLLIALKMKPRERMISPNQVPYVERKNNQVAPNASQSFATAPTMSDMKEQKDSPIIKSDISTIS